MYLVQQQIKVINEQIVEDILKLIQQQNGPISFRQLAVMTHYDPQQIWWSLRHLQKEKIIESCKISNTKSAWKLQHWYTDASTKNP